MAVLTVIIDGTPIAYSRRSFQSKNRPKGVGTKQAHRALRDLTRMVSGAVVDFQRRTGSKWDPEQPVKIHVDFVFPRPKSEGGSGRGHGKTRIRIEHLRSKRWKTGGADVDNLSKLVMESLQHGRAVRDDGQVVQLKACKFKEK